MEKKNVNHSLRSQGISRVNIRISNAKSLLVNTCKILLINQSIFLSFYEISSYLFLEESLFLGKSDFFNGESKSVSVKALGFVNLLKIKRSEFMKI